MTLGTRSSCRRSGSELIAVGLVGLIVFGIVAARLSPERVIGAVEGLMTTIRGLGFQGAVTLAALQVLVAVSGILPASLLGAAAGAIYGFVPGFLLATSSTLAGAMLSFLVSRSLLRPVIERWAARRQRLCNLDGLVAREGWRLVCLLRVSPIMPFSATSYLLGLSAIRLRDYAAGTLASLPALGGYVFTGTLADTGLSSWASGAGLVHWLLLAIGGLATLLLIVRLKQIAARLGLVSGLGVDHRAPAGDRRQVEDHCKD
ncbi:MAG: TVP38/TMEM64 family protein [Alphaproteobacteria bacterium]|nr:TVP38/TMEM64 family protein [Alphaproteobacteria bacterium]MBV8334097.1 TVP38/TMEM64 family protein [Alphaproteobacteria bacterium]